MGCTTCHSGEKLTNNQSLAIDSVNKAKLQVPSLVAVGYRAPYLHDGCAATLQDRFTAPCDTGNQHGNIQQLTASQIDDLVAYLQSL